MTASADVANTVPAVLLTTATAYSAHARAADQLESGKDGRSRITVEQDAPPQAGPIIATD
ncbi:hypothetical protein IFM47457_00187 [Aspergillus lentulus]|nr:hypothetical protein IFM47457_00187 [Aspergillus lentulus]